MSGMNPLFPAEVWPEILKYLPVKMLGQCRCVCKYWDSLIVSPFFMAAHFKYYTLNESKTLLLYRHALKSSKTREQYTLFLDSAEQDANIEPVCTLTHPFVTDKKNGYFRVVGSLYGLVCLSDDLMGYTYLIIIWNPLIHKYIKLPMPKVCYHIHGAYISILGFGYNSKECDHKVVRLVYIRDSRGYDRTPPVVEVFSLRNGRWKGVSAECLVDHCICDRWWSQCFLNGAIHWISWKRDAKTGVFERNWLILYDVEGEKFKRMKLPEELSRVCVLDLRVSEYGGKLSVLHSVLSGGIIQGNMKRCEIWVKKEYNVGTSWKKVVNIELDKSLGLGWVQCLRKNGELLAFTMRGELVSYDPKTKQKKGLGRKGCWLTWFTGSYEESLILLDRKFSVKAYGAAESCRKKRFQYRFSSNGDHALEEIEVDPSSEDDDSHSTTDNKIMYEPDKFLLYEQFMKLKVGANPEEIMSSAVSYGF